MVLDGSADNDYILAFHGLPEMLRVPESKCFPMVSVCLRPSPKTFLNNADDDC